MECRELHRRRPHPLPQVRQSNWEASLSTLLRLLQSNRLTTLSGLSSEALGVPTQMSATATLSVFFSLFAPAQFPIFFSFHAAAASGAVGARRR